MKKLPLGIQSLSALINNNNVYIDKTRFVYQMVMGNRYYFLFRPRRFGKSLLVSTLAELFSGNRELFGNLWIASSDYDWAPHPVIHLDFTKMDYKDPDRLEQSLILRLKTIACFYGASVIETPSAKDLFNHLIEQLAHINQVVVLIDEYDKPILEHIDNSDRARAQREWLGSFYGVLKDSGSHLRFVFLTGVTKFSQASIFSGLNHLTDISLDESYAAMLGYTYEEIQEYLADHVALISKKLKISVDEIMLKLHEYYDGYQFAENSERMFNPYSVLTCLDKQKFGFHWFDTGTPTFLTRLIKKIAYSPSELDQPVLDASRLGAVDVDKIPLTALLFQTGYLTIKQFDFETQDYTLDFPNSEVRDAFITHLTDLFIELPPEQTKYYAKEIAQALKQNNLDDVQKLLQDLFNKMPQVTHVKYERDVHFMLYCIFKLIGIEVDSEVVTSIGRADLVVKLSQRVYVIELKLDQPAQVALEQIQDRRYYEKYLNTNCDIILVGCAVDSKTKKIDLVYQALSTTKTI